MSAANGNKPTAVAQLVEQRIPNPQVAGSSPSRRVEDLGSPERHKFSFGLYKFGQGYWVRMMTASMLGVLVMSAALWVAKELATIPMPMKGYTLQLQSVTGEVSPGATVALYPLDAAAASIGEAKVESYKVGAREGGEMVVKDVTISEKNQSIADVKRVAIPGAGGQPPAFAATSSAPAGIPVVQLIYIQAGVAILILIVGSVLGYWYVGLKPATVDFLIATDGEMKKVNWSTKKIIRDSTGVVIAATFIIAGLLFIFDLALHTIAKLIGVMDV